MIWTFYISQVWNIGWWISENAELSNQFFFQSISLCTAGFSLAKFEIIQHRNRIAHSQPQIQRVSAKPFYLLGHSDSKPPSPPPYLGMDLVRQELIPTTSCTSCVTVWRAAGYYQAYFIKYVTLDYEQDFLIISSTGLKKKYFYLSFGLVFATASLTHGIFSVALFREHTHTHTHKNSLTAILFTDSDLWKVRYLIVSYPNWHGVILF